MYRTIDQAYAYLKELDPNTALTKYYLRVLCQTNQITVLNIGSKFLIQLESLCDFLKIKLSQN